MKQLRHTIQQHNLHMQTPVRLSHVNLYHCDTTTADVFPGHPYAKIIYVKDGSGVLHYGDCHIPVCAGLMILTNPEKQKFSMEIHQSPMDIVILGMEHLSFVKKENLLDHPFLFRCPDSGYNPYSFFISQISEEILNKSPSFEEVCNHYTELLLIFLQRDTEIVCTSFQEDKPAQDCRNIKEYLDRHFTENITLDTLSEKSGMNKYYLVHSFTKKYVRSPISYLNEKRIDESKKLLETTDYSIAEISRRIGFSSQSYFSQAFKKKTLMTPNEYRHSVQK